MAAPQDLEILLERSRLMRESLCKSQANTDNMIAVLSSFDDRLSELDTAMRPTQVHTHAIKKAHDNINDALKFAEKILSQFNVSKKVESKIIEGPRKDLNGYLAAVNELRNNVHFLTHSKSFKPSDSLMNRANGLLSKAIVALEKEFEDLLSSNSKSHEPAKLIEHLKNSVPSASSSKNEVGCRDELSLKDASKPSKVANSKGIEDFDLRINPQVIYQLHELAQQIISGGRHQQCCNIYGSVRAFVLEQTLQKLGVDKLVRDDTSKLQLDVLKEKITSWIQYMQISVKLLFPFERKLCDEVFYQLDPYGGVCFDDVISKSITMLLSFGENIVKRNRSPEKFFVLLEMYETMKELSPEVEAVLKGSSSSSIFEAVYGLTQRLGQVAKEMFISFQDCVEKDPTKIVVPDGGVHPLTSFVMVDYVRLLIIHKSTLGELIGEDEKVESANSQLAAATVKIMSALQTSLEEKSKLYNDPALAHVFMMNNVHYIVKCVRRYETNQVLGEDWVQRHRRIVQQHAQNYKRVAWAKVLQSLSVQGLTSSGSGVGFDGSMSTGVSRTLLKERFKTFNVQFEELYQRQRQWSVPDSELRESLRLAVAEVLLPAYRSFLKRFGSYVEGGKNAQKFIKFTPDELDGMLGELFEGSRSKANANSH
ncbi:hypothetical protein KP509_01G062100 [Ceratopteris richardii]|uniref:Exocyst subunit Exo70 family protein n=1 Tax=Ceratopteris richardii TaxID=49495 RepID=A0A8T2VLV6_CERRI|nr:hypothetical protein KP509_01G062100 [Ceratopteris richardii]